MEMAQYTLSAAEAQDLDELSRQLATHGYDTDGHGLSGHSWRLLRQVPEDVQNFIHAFKHEERTSACLVRGLRVNDREIGATPLHWSDLEAQLRTRPSATALLLYALCLGGDVFGWSTLQRGRLVTDVLPIPGEQSQQSGHGQTLLEWHTEDAFHPQRCDYLLLLGLRNDDRVPTTVASIRDIQLPEQCAGLLRQPHFVILPDNEHIRQLTATDPTHRALEQLRTMRDNPQPVPILYGDHLAPYMCVDPYFMRCVEGVNPAAQAALDQLVRCLDSKLSSVDVQPGTLLIIDNHTAVHGRAAFRARFDGRDRWLKKATVTMDIRASRHLRRTARSRVLY
ncbi:hypothetical protein NUM3379_22330 [Kineococcus sp. NUM-3379]